VTDCLILGYEGVGVAGLLTVPGALLLPAHGCQPETLLGQAQDVLERMIPWQSVVRQQWQRPASLRVPRPERLHACVLPAICDEDTPRAGCDTLLTRGTWTATMLLPTAMSDRSEARWFRRLVSLSSLGWAFVLAAVLWELFALAFSQCSGCGWAKGAFFFTWGLGVLAFGFFLRTGRERPAVSRLFLGVNILVVSVLSLVVATR
jgi:hypothetical protein